MVCKKISKGKCKILKKQCSKGYEYKMGKKKCSILKKGTKAKAKKKKSKKR
jgi:hypothetical protein